jgi:hypothetical protein
MCCTDCTEVLGSLLVLSKDSTRCPTCGETKLVNAGNLWKKIVSDMERSVKDSHRISEKGL